MDPPTSGAHPFARQRTPIDRARHGPVRATAVAPGGAGPWSPAFDDRGPWEHRLVPLQRGPQERCGEIESWPDEERGGRPGGGDPPRDGGAGDSRRVGGHRRLVGRGPDGLGLGPFTGPRPPAPRPRSRRCRRARLAPLVNSGVAIPMGASLVGPVDPGRPSTVRWPSTAATRWAWASSSRRCRTGPAPPPAVPDARAVRRPLRRRADGRRGHPGLALLAWSHDDGRPRRALRPLLGSRRVGRAGLGHHPQPVLAARGPQVGYVGDVSAPAALAPSVAGVVGLQGIAVPESYVVEGPDPRHTPGAPTPPPSHAPLAQPDLAHRLPGGGGTPAVGSGLRPDDAGPDLPDGRALGPRR